MASREDLHNKLKELLGSPNVYYQPPESIKMEYPAIRYSKKNISGKHADDIVYSMLKSYEIIVIDRKPDNEVIDKLLRLPYCSFDRPYKANDLNHDVLTLYY